ncbi:MAG: hypothetical protein LBV71_19845 [Prevotella sp.]|jgi:hypothetical protein|nr:hypothetical protein [Prevotella sp.]
MKNLILLFLPLIVILSSCSDSEDTTMPKETNKFKTGIDMSAIYNFNYQNKGVDEQYFMIGYGYDMTGKFAHPAWVRNKIIDIENFESDYDGRIGKASAHVFSSELSIGGAEESYRKELAKIARFSEIEVEKYKNLFREAIIPAFNRDTAFTNLNYYYSGISQIHSWYRTFLDYDILIENLNNKYLTEEFKKDIQEKSPEEIIRLYGTHVLTSVLVGERVDFLYRTSNVYSNESSAHIRLLNNCSYFSLSPTELTETLNEVESNDKENIYFEVIGGKSPKNGWMVDVTNYKGTSIAYDGWDKLTNDNLALIGFTTTYNTQLPIYELIIDSSKKEALKKAVEKYLSE